MKFIEAIILRGLSSKFMSAYSDFRNNFFLLAGPAIPSVVTYPKRSQTSTADSELKEDGIASRKPGSSAAGGKGIAPSSPMLGNAGNPNKADIPERKKSTTAPSVSAAFKPQPINCNKLLNYFLLPCGPHAQSQPQGCLLC